VLTNLKNAAAVVLLASAAVLAQNPTDFFPVQNLKERAAKLAAQSKKQGGAFAGETLTKYGNHLTMLAHREMNGSSELHTKDADIFMVVEGDATLVTGGKMVKAQKTAENELRGTGIEGGTSKKVSVGDVVHIQPNVPHQLLLAPGHIITYFVVKVTE
jgi:mannose-6-phosphate isomerase-like protein (cupin superfamily)